MKSVTILSSIAITICPALSHPQNAATDYAPDLAPLDPRSALLPYACTKANTLVETQLAEIEQLKSRNLPVPADLAGYVFAVEYGRRIAGCPSISITTAGGRGNSTTVKKSKRSDEPDGVYGDACNTLRVLREQVLDQMYVLRKYSIPIPPYLAGWWTLTNDAAQILQDGGGCPNTPHTEVGESATSWSP